MKSRLLVLALTPALLLSQTPPNPPAEISAKDAPATFTSKVSLVLVPVVVRDRDRKTVGTLKAEDFQLYDKGKLQTIAKFSLEKSTSKLISVISTPNGKDPVGAEPTTPTATIAAPEHFVAYLFDDIHLQFGDLVQVREAAWKHISSTLKPSDRAAIYTTSGQTMQEFTDDPDKLHETLMKLRTRPVTRSSAQECPDISFYQADLIQNKNDPSALNVAARETLACYNMDPKEIEQARRLAQSTASRVVNEGEHETKITFAVLSDIVRRMTAVPGQRTIILVSPGFLRMSDQLQEETAIMDRAIKGNVTISALDARGLYTDTPDISKRTISIAVATQKAQLDRESARQSADVLAELADNTGGTFIQNTNDLVSGFKEVAAAPEYYYILGFSPQNLKLDGSYHTLKVTLKSSPGLTAKARRGYYAPRRLSDADEDAKEEISQALFSRDEMNDIPIEIHTQFFKSSDVTAQLTVVARIDVRKLRFRRVDDRNGDDLVVVYGLFDRNGNYIQGVTKKLEMRLKDDTLATRINSGISLKSDFKVGTGTYVIRLVVRDAEGQMMAARNGAVEIP